MIYWIRRKHPHLTWKQTRRRYYGVDRIRAGNLVLYNPAKMRVERYRYRGTQIATPFNIDVIDPAGARFRRTQRPHRALRLRPPRPGPPVPQPAHGKSGADQSLPAC